MYIQCRQSGAISTSFAINVTSVFQFIVTGSTITGVHTPFSLLKYGWQKCSNQGHNTKVVINSPNDFDSSESRLLLYLYLFQRIWLHTDIQLSDKHLNLLISMCISLTALRIQYNLLGIPAFLSSFISWPRRCMLYTPWICIPQISRCHAHFL